jgi:restriction endonuclease
LERRNDPLWKRYEESVQNLLASLDGKAEVVRNRRIRGRLSQVGRQVDVWVRGAVVGVEIVVAVECKRHRRPMNIGVIDEFAGKLLDLGADRGIVYSYSGFTSAAVARAAMASTPSIMTVALKTPDVVMQLQSVPGYPADLLVQDFAPIWFDDLDEDSMFRFLSTGEWPKFWM